MQVLAWIYGLKQLYAAKTNLFSRNENENVTNNICFFKARIDFKKTLAHYKAITKMFNTIVSHNYTIVLKALEMLKTHTCSPWLLPPIRRVLLGLEWKAAARRMTHVTPVQLPGFPFRGLQTPF